MFQREYLDVSAVMNQIEATKERLKVYKESSGSSLQAAHSELSNTTKYRNMVITNKQALHMQFQNSANKYIDNLIDNIDLTQIPWVY